MSSNFYSSIFLYGPSGSGKTTIGKKLAETFNWKFVDLDQEIERWAGFTIPEIFETQGEAIFRQYETNLLIALLKGDHQVIALGGGTLLSPDNRRNVENAGKVLCLSATVDTLAQRLNQSQTQRPLVMRKDEPSLESLKIRLSDLLAMRSDHYSSFTSQLNTAGISIEEAVWLAQVQLGIFHLQAMGNGYIIHVQSGLLPHAGSIFVSNGFKDPVGMVVDSNVARHYANKVIKSFTSSGMEIFKVTISAGESNKNLRTVVDLWEAFISGKVERSSTILALGGGVVSDVAGFAAATFLRGIPWAIIPTTLLSMVDASLGGKTGIDLPQGKNLAGSFYAPGLILVDPVVLNTLPQEEFTSGLAEVVKAGIIADPSLFTLCAGGLSLIKENMIALIHRAMAVKIKIIEIDPYEKGIRAALNYGHTIGHAIELASGFQLKHGEAIAIGMVLEARLAEMAKLCPSGLSDEIAVVLKGIGLPTTIPAGYSYQDIAQFIKNDKKRVKGTVRFALPTDIGNVVTNVILEEKWINQLF